MSSPTSLHFPDAATITQYLSDHSFLNNDCYQENGITKAIAELAAARFADIDIEEQGIKKLTMLLIYDLQRGKDGYTGKALPDLGKLGLPAFAWNVISMATEKALIDCANSAKV